MPPAILGPVAGAVAGGLISKVGQPDAPQARSAFELFPPELQALSRESIFPGFAQLLQQQFQPAPTTRAIDPRLDPFASQAAFQIQQLRDLGQIGQPPPTPAAQPTGELTGDILASQFLTSIAQSPSNIKFGSQDLTPTRATDFLQGGLQRGQFGLTDLGQALGDIGFGTTQFTPQNIDLATLLQGLA